MNYRLLITGMLCLIIGQGCTTNRHAAIRTKLPNVWAQKVEQSVEMEISMDF